MEGSGNIEMYIELLNGLLGIGIFIITLSVFLFTKRNPGLIKSYFFLKGGSLSKPFFFFMIGMFIWGLREFYMVLEISNILKIEMFYEITELFSAISLLSGMIYFYNIASRNR